MPKKQISKTISSELLARALGFLLSILLARQLAIDDFGRWNYIQAIFLYLAVLIEFGSNQEGLRNLVRTKNIPSEFESAFKEVIQNRTIGTALAAALLIILPLLDMLSISETLALATCTLAYLISKDWYLRAIDRQFIASLQNTLHLTGLVALIYLSSLLQKTNLLSPDALVTAKGLILGATTLAITLFYLPKEKSRTIISLKITLPSSSVIYLVLGSLLAKAYFSSDIIIIEIMLDSHQVGLYSAMATIYAAFIAFRGVIINTLYPGLCSTVNTKELSRKVIKTSTLFGVSLLPAFSLAYVYSEELITIFLGARYLSDNTLELANIFIATCVILSFGLLYPNALHVNGMSKAFFTLTLFASAINITGNILLIPIIGITAAAYTTLIAESFVIAASAVIFFSRPRR